MVLLTSKFGKAAGDPFGVESDLFAGDILEALVGRVIPVSLPFAQAAEVASPAADSAAKSKPVETFNTAALGKGIALAKQGPAAKLAPDVVKDVPVTPGSMNKDANNRLATAGEVKTVSAQIQEALKQNQTAALNPKDAKADNTRVDNPIGKFAAATAIGAVPGAMLAAGAEALHPGAGLVVKTISAAVTAGAGVKAIMDAGQGPSEYNTERVSRKDAKASSSFASKTAPTPVNVATNTPAPAALAPTPERKDIAADVAIARDSLESMRAYTKMAAAAGEVLSLDGQATKSLYNQRVEHGVVANEANVANAIDKNENGVRSAAPTGSS